MIEPTVETIKADVCAFIEWMWINGNYQIAYIGFGQIADPLTPNELLQLATRFAHERATQLRPVYQKVDC